MILSCFQLESGPSCSYSAHKNLATRGQTAACKLCVALQKLAKAPSTSLQGSCGGQHSLAPPAAPAFPEGSASQARTPPSTSSLGNGGSGTRLPGWVLQLHCLAQGVLPVGKAGAAQEGAGDAEVTSTPGRSAPPCHLRFLNFDRGSDVALSVTVATPDLAHYVSNYDPIVSLHNFLNARAFFSCQ